MKFVGLICVLLAMMGISWGLKHPICGLQPASNGNGGPMCLAYMPSWTYYPSGNECKLFIYGGCRGNDNQFSSKEKCEAKCKE